MSAWQIELHFLDSPFCCMFFTGSQLTLPGKAYRGGNATAAVGFSFDTERSSMFEAGPWC